MENKSIAIKTNNLSKSFGALKAVDALNIEINHREVFSLLGRNGAGKTTTIKMLCCLLMPSSGSAKTMGGVFETIGYALPFAHAVDATQGLLRGSSFADIRGNFYFILIYALIFFVLAILSFRWRTKRR